MRILAFDPGAKRLGWSFLEKSDTGTYTYVGSGVAGLERIENDKYWQYQHALVQFWIEEFEDLVALYEPDHIVSEIVPPTGGSSANLIQRASARTALTACMAFACVNHWGLFFTWHEIAANTIKKNLTGDHKASKVKVRDAVLRVFPELQVRKKQLTDTADEADAIGIGLVGLGYKETNNAGPRKGSKRGNS